MNCQHSPCKTRPEVQTVPKIEFCLRVQLDVDRLVQSRFGKRDQGVVVIMQLPLGGDFQMNGCWLGWGVLGRMHLGRRLRNDHHPCARFHSNVHFQLIAPKNPSRGVHDDQLGQVRVFRVIETRDFEGDLAVIFPKNRFFRFFRQTPISTAPCAPPGLKAREPRFAPWARLDLSCR